MGEIWIFAFTPRPSTQCRNAASWQARSAQNQASRVPEQPCLQPQRQRGSSFYWKKFSITCDSASVNQALAKECGITLEQTSFKNPAAPDLLVWWLFDCPHIEKLMRNHLKNPDKGFILANGKKIGRPQLDKLFRALESKCVTDLRIAPKLNYKRHVDISDQDLQHVAPAYCCGVASWKRPNRGG